MKRVRGKYWDVLGPCGLKLSRNCAGMNETALRSRHNVSDEARRLLVYGTLDPLARKRTAQTVQTTRYVLSDAGKLRLRKLRGRSL